MRVILIVIACVGGLGVCIFVISWISFTMAYDAMRDREPAAIRDLMPTGNQAFWLWVRGRGPKP